MCHPSKCSPTQVALFLHVQINDGVTRGGSRKKYWGRGLSPHHLGGNNEQNYCVQLSSIKQLMYRNYPENLWGGPGQDLGGPCPPGPNLEPPLGVTGDDEDDDDDDDDNVFPSLLNVAALQEWTDYKLAWNKSEYGNVQSIRITPNDIWTPDILLYNRCEGQQLRTLYRHSALELRNRFGNKVFAGFFKP